MAPPAADAEFLAFAEHGGVADAEQSLVAGNRDGKNCPMARVYSSRQKWASQRLPHSATMRKPAHITMDGRETARGWDVGADDGRQL